MEQVQYSDMYILSIPAFTWVKAPQSGSDSHTPSARAGHTCNLRDGQIVVVGGYLSGADAPCDAPGIYVFNATSLEWTAGFRALDHRPDLHPENSVLANSYGYRVPAVVADAIGGDADGGATATTPSAGPATGGPFATGKSPAFTITKSGSATATVTQWGPGATHPGAPTDGGNDNNKNNNERKMAGLIAAGVIAGLAGLLAAYLGYCAWLYRRQVRAYKSHLAMANRYSPGGGNASVSALSGLAAFFGAAGREGSKGSRGSSRRAQKGPLHHHHHHREEEVVRLSTGDGSSTSAGGIGVAMTTTTTAEDGEETDDGAGAFAVEPKLLFDDEPTPESGYYSGSVGGARPALGSSANAGGSGTTPGSAAGRGRLGDGDGDGAVMVRRSGSRSSGSSTEALLDGQEPSFFSVVMGPRRALRVVNGLEGEHEIVDGVGGGGGGGGGGGPGGRN